MKRTKKILAFAFFGLVMALGMNTNVQAKETSVSYRTHVQTYGWQSYVKDGEMSGTSGKAKRLEGINIRLNNQEYSGGIKYRTHVQTYGWRGYVENGAMSGTSGQSKRLEAIQIELTGEMANHYDVYYRVHCQTYGWLGWAKNGKMSGTAGYGKRLEGIQIKLVEKGGKAPGSTTNAFKDKNHKHSYELKEKVDATCTEDGYRKYVCKTCGNIYREKVNKLGHDFSIHEEHREASCDIYGRDIYKCSRCDKTKWETTDALGHIFDDSKVYKYNKGSCTERATWYIKCKRCNAMKLQKGDYADHEYELQKETQATCTEDGYKYYKCRQCGTEKSEKTASKLNHDFSVLKEHKDGTCTTKSYDLYQCTRCDQTQKIEGAYGDHSYVETSSNDASTTYTCSVCGATKVESNDREYTIDLGNGQTMTVTGHFERSMEAKLFDMLNEYRAENGVEALEEGSEALKNAADIRGYEISYSFSHTRPNGERALTSFNVTTDCCAENIAKYQTSAEEVMEMWKNSAGHNGNMLSKYLQKISISVFARYERTRDDGTNVYSYHFVQLFGW